MKIKKAHGKTQALCTGRNNAEPKKFNQLDTVTTCIDRPSLLKIDACNFELLW